MDYLHYNPVKHGYVDRVGDWPHSTFHSLVNKEIYPKNWAASELTLSVGESVYTCGGLRFANPPYKTSVNH